METTSYIALSRQSALRREMDIIANNLANMNTHGFKTEQIMFVDHLHKNRGHESFRKTEVHFTRDVAQFFDRREGPIESTGNPLDLALKGEAYFVVTNENGDERFTRNGRFALNNEGALVNQSGFEVQSTAGAPIFIAPEDTEITVSADGTISTNNGTIGQLRVVEFDDPHNLDKDGFGLTTTDQQPIDVERPTVLQGALEGSNVEPILEMTKMIRVHRAYQSVQSFLEREDQRQRQLIEQLARTTA